MKKILQFLMYLCFFLLFWYLLILFSRVGSEILGNYMLACPFEQGNSIDCDEREATNTIIANILSLILIGVIGYLFFRYCNKFIQSLSGKMLIGIFLLLAIVFIGFHFGMRKEFPQLPIKIIVKAFNQGKEGFYILNLAEVKKNSIWGDLAITANEIKNLPQMHGIKTSNSNEYRIDGFNVFKNKDYYYTLDFGHNTSSYLWYDKSYLLFKGTKGVHTKEMDGKDFLDPEILGVFDIEKKEIFWLQVIDSQSIGNIKNYLRIKEILGYIL